MQDMAGKITTYYRDNAGRAIGTVFPGGSMITNHYNRLSELTNTVETVGSISVSTTNWFNNQGLLVLSSNHFGQVRKLTHDIDDHVTNSVDHNGVSVDMTYDELGRILTRTYPDTGVEQYHYSVTGLTNHINPEGKATFYGYNEAGWKRFETNANLDYLQLEYDRAGNLKTLHDERQNQTTWSYDQYSRITRACLQNDKKLNKGWDWNV